MVRFSAAPIEVVAPRLNSLQPSKRDAIQAQYRQALDAAFAFGEAVVVDLGPEDAPLTIRAGVNKPATALVLENIRLRRRGGQIVAWVEAREEG